MNTIRFDVLILTTLLLTLGLILWSTQADGKNNWTEFNSTLNIEVRSPPTTNDQQ